MKIKWISHACFQIITESGKVIYLDPYEIPTGLEKADIVISSHSHGDHMDSSSIRKISKDSTIVIGPESESDNLTKFNGKGLKLGVIFEVEDIKIQLVPAYTIKKSTHPKNRGWAGIIIEAEGKRTYHAGDTERIPEMKDLKDIDVAMLPCGGTYTMDFDESTDAACDINPKIAIPMHNWGKDLNQFKEMLKNKNSDIIVEILEDKDLQL
ncbi:MAG: MBL fold metallo-hydrolase [Candidatus Lokiarchaeota archaeon]|nr:MBL fold metallo-hydrolase [Candidatus Lokiarchaeota archaeon]